MIFESKIPSFPQHRNVPTQHSISRKICQTEKLMNFHTVYLFVSYYYLNESSTNEGLLRPWLLQRLEAFYLAPKFLTHWIKRPKEKKGYHKIFTLTEEQNLQKIFVSLPRCDSFNAKMCLRIWGNIHTITSKEFEFCEMCTSIVAKTHFVKTGVLRNFPWKFGKHPRNTIDLLLSHLDKCIKWRFQL